MFVTIEEPDGSQETWESRGVKVREAGDRAIVECKPDGPRLGFQKSGHSVYVMSDRSDTVQVYRW